MEQWQIDAIAELLSDTETKEVEPGQRVYTSSQTYGIDRYHLLERLDNGVQVEQVDVGEKWNKRVNLYSDEIPAVLKTLLAWYLEDVQKQNEAEAVEAAAGDLPDESPF